MHLYRNSTTSRQPQVVRFGYRFTVNRTGKIRFNAWVSAALPFIHTDVERVVLFNLLQHCCEPSRQLLLDTGTIFRFLVGPEQSRLQKPSEIDSICGYSVVVQIRQSKNIWQEAIHLVQHRATSCHIVPHQRLHSSFDATYYRAARNSFRIYSTTVVTRIEYSDYWLEDIVFFFFIRDSQDCFWP